MIMHLIKSEIRRFSKPGTKINLFNWHFKWSICCNRNNRYWLDKTTPIRLFFLVRYQPYKNTYISIRRDCVHSIPSSNLIFNHWIPTGLNNREPIISFWQNKHCYKQYIVSLLIRTNWIFVKVLLFSINVPF